MSIDQTRLHFRGTHEHSRSQANPFSPLSRREYLVVFLNNSIFYILCYSFLFFHFIFFLASLFLLYKILFVYIYIDCIPISLWDYNFALWRRNVLPFRELVTRGSSSFSLPCYFQSQSATLFMDIPCIILLFEPFFLFYFLTIIALVSGYSKSQQFIINPGTCNAK